MTVERRSHSRAPLGIDILYVDDIYVFKAVGENISKGGILLKLLPHIPQDELIHLMVAVPRIGQLHLMSIDSMKNLARENLEYDIFRLKGKARRTERMRSAVDEVFDQKLAIEFSGTDPKICEKISDYVSNMASNLVTMLKMLDSLGKDEEKLWRLKKVATYLGYTFSSTNELRHMVLRDYQGLEVG